MNASYHTSINVTCRHSHTLCNVCTRITLKIFVRISHEIYGLCCGNLGLYCGDSLESERASYARSRRNFRAPNPKIFFFSLTIFQEREYDLHFTNIQPTLLLFSWSGFIYPTTTRTFDRKTSSQSLLQKEDSLGLWTLKSIWGQLLP